MRHFTFAYFGIVPKMALLGLTDVGTVKRYSLMEFIKEIDSLNSPEYCGQSLLVLGLITRDGIGKRITGKGASTAELAEIISDLPRQGCLLFTCNSRNGFQFRKFVLEVNPERENDFGKSSHSFMQDIQTSFKTVDSFCILFINKKFTEFATLRRDIYKKSEKGASDHKGNYIKNIRSHPFIGLDHKYIIISELGYSGIRDEVMDFQPVKGNVVHDKEFETEDVTSIDQLVSSKYLHGVQNSSVLDFMFLGNLEKPGERLKALYGPSDVVNAILEGVVHSLAIWSGIHHVIYDVTSTDGTVRGHVLMDHVHVGHFVESVTGNHFNRGEDHKLIDWVIQKLPTAGGQVRIVTSNLLRGHQFVTNHSGIGALVYKEYFPHPLLIEVEQSNQ